MSLEPVPAGLEISELTEATEGKLKALEALIAGLGRVVVAYSGGVDSAFVLKVAHEVLGDRSIALTARSASMMGIELEDAIQLAKEIGARHEIVDTHELQRPGYAANAPTRCYFCKTELFDATALRALAHEGATVIDGFNAGDHHDHAQGHRAATEHGVRHPLAEVGLKKPEIRALSQRMGLRTWKKPQLACLSSRVPHGMAVTKERLARIEEVELTLRELGFFDIRARLVRENDDMVRIELGAEEIERAVRPKIRERIVAGAHHAGFRFVALDLEGFKSGRLAEAGEGLVRLGRKTGA